MLVLIFAAALVVVLFHFEAANCVFVAVAFTEARSVLNRVASAVSVACACGCAVSCL